MPKKIKIHIPKPCNKSWSNFGPAPGGGFCSSCQKEVVDFTSWQEKDIYHFLKNSSQTSCGRFRQEQLRTYVDDKPTGPAYKNYLTGLLGLLALFSARDARTQPMPVATAQHETQPGRSTKANVQANSQQHAVQEVFSIQGTVVEERSGEAIPGVSVSIKNTQLNAYTDIDGNFRLPVSGEENEKVVLIIRFIGYETVEKEVILQEKIINLGKIPLLEDVHLIGEVIVVARKWSPRWIWWQIRSIF